MVTSMIQMSILDEKARERVVQWTGQHLFYFLFGDAVEMTRGTQEHLKVLENEAVHALREVAAQFERPVLMFSGGKDSIVLAWLARKAFHPAPIPFPLLHIDTSDDKRSEAAMEERKRKGYF